MSLIRREKRSWTPEPFVPPFPGFSGYGMGGTPNSMSALQSSAVWACVRLVSSTVAMMPLSAYTLRNGVRVPIDTPPLLQKPSNDTTLADWIYMIMSALLLRGNAYGRIVQRDSQLYPTQIELLPTDEVALVRDTQTGVITYKWRQTAIPAQDLFHVRGFRMAGYDYGLSPIQQGALMINRDAAIQQFSLGYFQDAPHPASTLTSDQPVSAEHARTIKERLIASINGREPLILGAGLKFTPLSVSPEESQFLATQKYGAAEICRLFGVPSQKVPGAEVGGSLTYSTVESSNIDLLVSTIQWWLMVLEASIAQLLPGQKHVRFDTSVLLRTDLETMLKATAIGIASHQMTPDEARAMRDMPPLTDEQKKELDLVQMTVSPSGMPKALPGTAPAGDPSAEIPAAQGASE